jgi:hypothetical protein
MPVTLYFCKEISMKKIVLLFVAGLVLGATAFAEEDTGALGFGIISDSSESSAVGGGIRGSLFLDAGTQLYGPFHYGFELQGDVKRLDQTSSSLQQTDIVAYYYGSSAVYFVNSTTYDITYTLWDLDVSPRGYLSFDLGNKVQLLGFLGLNYNWQTLDYEAKSRGTDKTYEKKTSTNLGGSFDLLAGFRVSVGAFYLDYTRFLRPDTYGNYGFNTYNKNRLGLGVNLRF